MIAICDAESGRNPAALGVNKDDKGRVVSYDRGLCQINDVAHPDVSSECAYDPVCALNAAFRISKSGMDFSPWSAYTNGRYQASMDAARVALDGLRLENQLAETIKQRNAAVLELREANGKIAAARQALA